MISYWSIRLHMYAALANLFSVSLDEKQMQKHEPLRKLCINERVTKIIIPELFTHLAVADINKHNEFIATKAAIEEDVCEIQARLELAVSRIKELDSDEST